MDKALTKSQEVKYNLKEFKQLGLPFANSLIYTSSDFFLYLVEELSDKASQLLWNIIARIQKGDTPDYFYEFTKNDILNELDMNEEKDHTRLKKIITEVSSCLVPIKADIPNGKSATTDLIPVFDRTRLQYYSKTIAFKFNSELNNFLFDIKGTQIRAFLKYIKKLSKKSAKLYFLLISQFKTRDREVELKYLKKYLGLRATDYPSFYDFKKRVLNPLLNELNENTDIRISWEAIRKGRTVIAIYFSFTEKYPTNSPRLKPSSNIPLPLVSNTIHSFIIKNLCLDEKQALNLEKKYSDNEIKGAYTLGMRKIYNKNNRSSKGGYFSKTIDSLVIEYNNFQEKKLSSTVQDDKKSPTVQVEEKLKQLDNKVLSIQFIKESFYGNPVQFKEIETAFLKIFGRVKYIQDILTNKSIDYLKLQNSKKALKDLRLFVANKYLS